MAFFGGHESGFPDFGVGMYTKSDDFLEKILNGFRPPPPSFLENYIAIFMTDMLSPAIWSFFFGNEGQLRLPVTQP